MTQARNNLQHWLRRTSVSSAVDCDSSELTYSCAQDLVQDRGRLFSSSPLSDTQLSIVFAAIRRAQNAGVKFVPQRCFCNATQLVLADRTGEISYVEGFALGQTLPIHHAWAIIGGKVVDLTWTHLTPVSVMNHDLGDRILGNYTSVRAYMGIPFPRQNVLERFQLHGNAQPFFDDNDWLHLQLRAPRKSKAPWQRASPSPAHRA